MRTIAPAVAVLVAGAIALPAQTPMMRPEIRPFAGASIPTGDHRDFFRDATLVGVQGALEMRPTFHLLASLGWARSNTKYAVSESDVHMLAYDVGAEWSFVKPLAEGWQLKPFIGAGAGARSYLYRSSALADKTCLVGYGALGSEFQLARVALRIEARDNVFCYRSPVAGTTSKTRNDVGIMAGLAFHLW